MNVTTTSVKSNKNTNNIPKMNLTFNTINNINNMRISPQKLEPLPIIYSLNVTDLRENIKDIKNVSFKTSITTHNNNNILIFDLTNDSLKLNTTLIYRNLQNIKSIIRLSVSSAIINNPSSDFQNLIKLGLNESERNFFYKSLISNKCINFAFFDGFSSYSKCLITTFNLLQKFLKFISSIHSDTVNISILEPTSLVYNAITQQQQKKIQPQSHIVTGPSKKKGKFNFTISLPQQKIGSADVFIKSIKESNIRYDENSLIKYFHIPSISSKNINNKNKINFPVWLTKIIESNTEEIILIDLFKKFQKLEELEEKRLEKCFKLDNDSSLHNSSDHSNEIPFLVNKSKSRTSLPPTNKHLNIYSLSILQKQFKHEKQINHKMDHLKITIPKMNNITNINNNNNSYDEVYSVSNCSSSDSDIEYTPLFNYEINKAVQSFNKNRYSNVLPYEHSRVKLKDKDDYFNANYINFPQINSNYKYIATQAPLPNTIPDFWNIIFKERISTIISLNSLEELKLRKWDIYWEIEEENSILDIKVINKWDNLKDFPGVTIRKFKMEKSNDPTLSRFVYQIQYSNWIDSCGIDIKGFLMIYQIKNQLNYNENDFVTKLNLLKDDKLMKLDLNQTNINYERSNDFSPLLVHCSAGCGRTGVFIAVDFLLSIFNDKLHPKNRINIWEMEDDLIFIIINEMRKQRIAMVQNFSQYITCYDQAISFFFQYPITE